MNRDPLVYDVKLELSQKAGFLRLTRISNRATSSTDQLVYYLVIMRFLKSKVGIKTKVENAQIGILNLYLSL